MLGAVVAVIFLPSCARSPSATFTPRPSVPAAPSGHTHGSVCPSGMRLFSGGSFVRYQATISIDRFCLSTYETTVAEYGKCVASHSCEAPTVAPPHTCASSMRDGMLAANCLDGRMAREYCAWRGGRLPTSDEWEWAARGGDAALMYPWGNEPLLGAYAKGVCWDRGGPCRVGAACLDVTRDGLSDMAGNVSEWTNDQGVLRRSGGAWLLKEGRKSSERLDYTYPPLDKHLLLMGVRCAANPADP